MGSSPTQGTYKTLSDFKVKRSWRDLVVVKKQNLNRVQRKEALQFGRMAQLVDVLDSKPVK